jgi:hypothetical protein
MTYTIHSRTLRQRLTFSRPGRQYIYLDWGGGHPGTLGQQICERGGLTGSTLTYGGEDEGAFAQICQRWYRAYLRNRRS